MQVVTSLMTPLLLCYHFHVLFPGQFDDVRSLKAGLKNLALVVSHLLKKCTSQGFLCQTQPKILKLNVPDRHLTESDSFENKKIKFGPCEVSHVKIYGPQKVRNGHVITLITTSLTDVESWRESLSLERIRLSSNATLSLSFF